ncbi:transporter substrate-binding domain-containing protein [Agromyces archimandritae]|nr:transporter substrate-binding domain-containing protein [Agromyces archimandritae]
MARTTDTMPEGGTNQVFAEEHYPEGEHIVWPDNTTIFDEIVAGRADVMTTDATETRWAAKQHPELGAVHPDEPFNRTEKAMMLPRDDTAFREYVDQWLTMERNNGTLDAVIEEWLG